MCLVVPQSNLNKQLPGAAVCTCCLVATLLSEGKGASGGLIARGDVILKQLMLIAKKNGR